MSLEVTYKGSQIAQLAQDGSLTLETAGKYCEDNIGLTYSGGGGPAKEVPDGYTQLLALRSSGVQCINTGFVANLNTKAAVEYELLPLSPGYYMYIFGSSSPNFYMLCVNSFSIDTYPMPAYTGFGNINDKQGGNYLLIARKTATIDKTQLAIVGNGFSQTISINASSMSGSDPLCIFGKKNGNTYDRKCAANVYRVKVWDNGTLVRHMVPCVRDSDDVLGMYDLCESTCPETNSPFYINVGSGTFVGVDYD